MTKGTKSVIAITGATLVYLTFACVTLWRSEMRAEERRRIVEDSKRVTAALSADVALLQADKASLDEQMVKMREALEYSRKSQANLEAALKRERGTK